MIPSIRKAVTKDVADIQRLYREGDAYHARLVPGVFRAAERARPNGLVETNILEEDSDYLLAVVNSRVVGFLEIKVGTSPEYRMFVPKRFAVVDNMVVDEEHRDLGIGTRLLEEATVWAEERGLRTIQLTVWCANTGAIRLYEHKGYVPIRQRMEFTL